MLSERQRNIVVDLTPADRTAQYIADRFDCSISIIWRIIKMYGETGRSRRLPGSGRPRKTTAGKNIERYTAHSIVSWPNPKQWVIVYVMGATSEGL